MRQETVKKAVVHVDAYAVEPRPSTTVGGAITVLVWLATVIYTAIIIYQWMTRPSSTTNAIIWSQVRTMQGPRA